LLEEKFDFWTEISSCIKLTKKELNQRIIIKLSRYNKIYKSTLIICY